MKERQQRRKLRELKTNIERALCFAKAFGLELKSVEFEDEAGSSHSVEYQTTDKGAKSFRNISEDEKNKVRQILFISDKFCIGEAAYHELTMVPGGEGIPRSYLVKQCKNYQLNQLCHVSKTPGPAEGAQLDFESELKNRIMQQASNLLL